MVFHETTIYTGFIQNIDAPITNLELVSLKSSARTLICKIGIDGKNTYFQYYTRSTMEHYIFIEIMNGSLIWEFDWECIKQEHNKSISIKVKIDIDQLLFSEYINNSFGLITLTTDKFDKLPLFDKTDFSSKSFISYETITEPNKNFKIKLYNYQKKSLTRMLKMERGETSFKIKYTVPLNIIDNEVLYDPISCRRVAEDKFININLRGGVLSDEMGLGKTITSIALICSNPAPANHSAVKYSDDYEMNKLFTKATLILCPSHLTKQWESEVNRCNSKLTVLSILTKKDMDKLTVADVQNADIIITSHQFLMNFKYYPTLHYKYVTASIYNSSERKAFIKNILSELLKNEEKLLTLETPIFEFFFFQRIIIDEGHEIFGEMLGNHALSRYMSDWVSSIDANYYWYVSGTPFINFTGIQNCAKFINLKLVEEERQLDFTYSNKRNIGGQTNTDIFSFLFKEYIWDNILSKICIRHRKIDVLDQIEIPGFDEKLIWLKFTDLEKQLYEAKKGKVSRSYLQQLCCHPMIIESSKKIFGDVEVDLTLMQDKLIEYHKNNYDSYKIKLEKLDKTKTEYHMLSKMYNVSMSESHYLFTILSKMRDNKIDEKENCSICLDELENPTLTACGHLFCYDCLKMCLGDKKKCPMCKADLTGKELLVTSKKTEISTEKINPLIQKYGSKLGKTISIIRTLVAQPKSRIIIFSQWDYMLSLIGKTLSENGIENSFVKGNVWSRNSAINKFKAGINNEGEENKVIMLSLKNSASGTNLTEATHILFIEPIDASSTEARAIEGQAIGRACRIGQKNKISVMRILIENSVEEEIYRSTYDKDVKIEFTSEDKLITQLISKKSKTIEV